MTAEYPDPLDPDWLLPARTWLHRTAAVPVDALEVREVDGLWLAPLLTGLDEQIVRTVSTHVHFTPAREAKATARRDVTTDQRDMLARARKGQMVDDDNRTRPVLRRPPDVRPGGKGSGTTARTGRRSSPSPPAPAPNSPPPARTWRPRPPTTPASTASTGWTPSSPPRTPPPGRSAGA